MWKWVSRERKKWEFSSHVFLSSKNLRFRLLWLSKRKKTLIKVKANCVNILEGILANLNRRRAIHKHLLHLLQLPSSLSKPNSIKEIDLGSMGHVVSSSSSYSFFSFLKCNKQWMKRYLKLSGRSVTWKRRRKFLSHSNASLYFRSYLYIVLHCRL